MPSEEQTYREGMKQDVKDILAQTKLTNGRVTKLEHWQSYVLGFCAAIALILLPILFYFAYAFLRTKGL